MAYSKQFRTEALVRLALSRYDYEATAEQVGVAPNTLRNWERQFPKVSVPELLSRALETLLARVPENMTGDDWSVAVGILMDKYLLLQGEATSRSEVISRIEEQLPEDADERQAILDEARQFVERLGAPSHSGGARQENGRPASS